MHLPFCMLRTVGLCYRWIGDVRGLGLLWGGVKLVMGPVVRTPFPAASNLFAKVTVVAKEKGLLIYLRRTLNGLLDELLTQTSLT